MKSLTLFLAHDLPNLRSHTPNLSSTNDLTKHLVTILRLDDTKPCYGVWALNDNETYIIGMSPQSLKFVSLRPILAGMRLLHY